jgi:hypothetical protein
MIQKRKIVAEQTAKILFNGYAGVKLGDIALSAAIL